MRSLFAALCCMALVACPGIDPVAPDKPPSNDPPMGTGGAPTPSPAPADSACENACVRRAIMKCGGAGPGCVEACERFEEEAKTAPALAWNPSCQSHAVDCAAADACRGK